MFSSKYARTRVMGFFAPRVCARPHAAVAQLGCIDSSCRAKPADLLPDVLKDGFHEEALKELAVKYRPLINLVLCECSGLIVAAQCREPGRMPPCSPGHGQLKNCL
eukprot:1148453-Pelagomonas_calceolata.AAC.7